MDTFNDHVEGFDAEMSFHIICMEIRKHCPDLKFGVIKAAIATIAPDFVASLYKSRPCNRQLRYIGTTWCPEIEPPTDHEYFKLGQLYRSSTFNGATYTFDGYGDGERRIGCAYFEWVKNE